MQILSQYICALLRSQTINHNSTNNCSKKYQLPNQCPCKSLTTQAALYLLQIIQLVEHFHSNSMQILIQYIYLRMIELSMHQLTIQLTIVQRNINSPNHDLARLLKFKQHYIYCKSHNNLCIPIRTACKSFQNISAHDCALNQSTHN